MAWDVHVLWFIDDTHYELFNSYWKAIASCAKFLEIQSLIHVGLYGLKNFQEKKIIFNYIYILIYLYVIYSCDFKAELLASLLQSHDPSEIILICCSKNIHWWIESLEEQHLSEIEIFITL